ncbi:TPA: hypothetical protein MH337_27370 [Klebsiella pneumoniae]|nr:hypothetical protein [Klebsiella pneumoniae]
MVGLSLNNIGATHNTSRKLIALMRVMKMSHASNKKRSLKLWEALALSLGMVGPTLGFVE